MDELDPSPRASKRRRTATYATRRTTLASSPLAPDEDSERTTARSSRKEIRQTAAAVEDADTSDAPEHENREEKTLSRKSGRRKTAEDEFLDIQASARAETRPKRSRKSQDAMEESVAEEEVQKNGTEETEIVRTRSAGSSRRSLRNSSPAVENSRPKSSPLKRSAQSSTTTNAEPDEAPQLVFSPQPKGILTPSRHGRGMKTGQRKSVVFQDDVNVDDKDERQIEKHFGFKDIGSSRKKSENTKHRRVSDSPDDQRREHFEDAAEYLQDQLANGVDDEEINEEESILADMPDSEDIESSLRSSRIHATKKAPSYTTDDEDPHLTSIKIQVLSRITNHSCNASPSSVPAYLETQYSALHSLLSATVTAGESNSLLLLGSRGSGKSLLVDQALSNLQRSHADDFHAVRLNGFFQTDDKLALREIWRQLGREMAVPEDETGEVSSYADTMASLLSLLSHPEELGDPDAMDVDATTDVPPEGVNRTSKSVIFVMDEFDLFTTHPRQTLLYNLFDIAQAKKAPIAVIGCSTRMDVVECLEKRVKSRFSHRWLHVPAAKSLVVFEETVRATLCLAIEGQDALGVTKDELEWRSRWNEFIKTQFLPVPAIHTVVKRIFYSTKSIADLLAALYISVATLALPATNVQDSSQAKSPFPVLMDSTAITPSLLALLPHLPLLHLSLLISATRLETIYDVIIMNFTLVHKQYIDLLTRSKLQRSSLSSFGKGGALTGAGLRSWSKETARGAWEELAQWEFIIPASGAPGGGRLGEEGLGGDGIVTKMFRVDVTLDEVAWAVKEKLGVAGAGENLIKWCKEV